MKKILISVFAISFASTAQAEENSTYNFYFQKAPGPVTVNQGGGATTPAQNAVSAQPTVTVVPAPAQPLPPPVANTSVTSAPDSESEKPKKFFLGMGYNFYTENNSTSTFDIISGKSKDYLNGQYALKGEYDISRLFSATAELHYLRKSIKVEEGRHYDPKGVVYGALPVPTNRAKRSLDFALGGAFNFIRLNTTTFSLVGGIVSLPYMQWVKVRDEGSRILAAPSEGIQREISPYAGLRLRLIADNVWGLDASYRAAFNTGRAIGQVNLTFAM